jgi:AcrR family transcriptional regulator
MQRRAYTQTVRAAAAERTAQKIFAAAAALFRDRPFDDVTLQAVADRAGVSLQTVLRKFGSKEALFEAASRSLSSTIMASRVPDVAGDTRSAIEKLVASYEEMGDLGWRGLTQEEQFPWVREMLTRARGHHRAWIEASFAHALPRRAGAERDRRVALLFAATDYYVWKLYRRDLGMGRDATLERMIELAIAASRG